MGILSNFIGGAAQAGGDILQKQRESDVDLNKQKSYADYSNDLAMKREQALATLREEQTIRAEGRQVDARRSEEAYQASPDRIDQLTAADARKQGGIINNRISLAPQAAKAGMAEFEAGAPMRKAEAAEKLILWKEEYGAKTAAQLEAEITKLNDPKYLSGKSKEAAAGRDPNSATLARIQLEGARLALKEKQEEAKLPAAVKDEIAGLRELLKGKSAIIDKATVEGMSSPEGIAKLEAEKSAISKRISQLREPYLPEGLRTPKAGADGLDPALAARIAEIAAGKGKTAVKPAEKPGDADPAVESDKPRAPVVYDPANPLSVVQRGAQRYDARKAAEPRKSAAELKAEQDAEQARRAAWLAGKK